MLGTNGIWLTLIGTLAPILLIVLFFILFMGSMRGDGNRIMSFGKSRASRMTKDQPKVTFSDVTGADEAVQELTEIKEFLEAPRSSRSQALRIPKGASWSGLRGTGKTLLARAVAGEASVPSSPSPARTSSRCSSVSAPAACVTYFEQAKQESALHHLHGRDRRCRPLARGGPWRAATTSASRPSASCWWRWTASIRRTGSSCSPPPTAWRSRPTLLRPGRFDRQIVVGPT